MKQYLNSTQTAKLMELGFEKPKGWCVEGISSRLIMYKHKEDNEGFNYSIGELIEMLPKKIEAEMEDESNDEYAWLSLEEGWDVLYRSGYYIVERVRHNKELIDALYEMIVKLKEEGII